MGGEMVAALLPSTLFNANQGLLCLFGTQELVLVLPVR